ncbi:MAG: Do family serine endopeptidase, partial [Candidatus Omnitrophota bacterium]
GDGLASDSQSQNTKPETPPPVSSEGYRIEGAVVNVANTTGKAVVSISTEHIEKVKGGRRHYFGNPFGESPFAGDESLRRFFDDFFGEIPDREYKQAGLGSGVIIDPQGYILTNEHVISDADKINVTLSDGRDFKGEVKGRDQRSDLAIIKINAQNLPSATFGDSDSLRIGQWVVAIGNPFGFAMHSPEPTVTVGVISALHRSLGSMLSREKDYNDLIQTDAAINPGNSGGPLVNLNGEVVGINVAIFSTSGGYQGVGFAIPVNSAKRIISRLIEGKKISYGWIGVTVQNLTEDLVKYLGLHDKNGVLVSKVIEGGPAQKGGFKESDVIRQFDNKAVNNVRELLNVVAKTEIGKKAKVALVREKKELTLEVQIGERPQNPEGEEGIPTVSGNWRGIEVEDITAENSRGFRVEEKKGVIVTNLDQGSAADDANLNPGDVILEINKQPIKNTTDYEKMTRGLKGDALVKTSRGYFVIKGAE